jgi:hypothetical protein
MGRRKRLLVMVVLGLMLWPAVLYAGAQAATGGCAPPGFNLQDKVTDQQLAHATGLGSEKPMPCQDGKIILWDEWGKVRPAPVNNMGNQGQVIIGGSRR